MAPVSIAKLTHSSLPSFSEIRHKREDVKEELTESDLDKVIDISLSETETIWLLDIPSICVSTESDEAQEVTDQNTRYEEVRWLIYFCFLFDLVVSLFLNKLSIFQGSCLLSANAKLWDVDTFFC